MKALIIDRVSPVIAKGLQALGRRWILRYSRRWMSLKRSLPEYDLLVMRVDPKIGRDILDTAAKRVKNDCRGARGTNHIDLEYARELGIRVQNAPGINCNAVAELVISKMIDLSRFYDGSESGGRDGKVSGINISIPAMSWAAMSLGIIGLGKIGSRVAELARAFNMKVAAYDPYVDAAAMKEKGADKAGNA